jgi:hypothetical protein
VTGLSNILNASSQGIPAYHGELDWISCGARWAPLHLELKIVQDTEEICIEFHSEGNCLDDEYGAYTSVQHARPICRRIPDSSVFETGPFVPNFPDLASQSKQQVWLRLDLKEVRDSRGRPFCFVKGFWKYSDQLEYQCVGLLEGYRKRRKL